MHHWVLTEELMPTTKQQKVWFMTDEALRVVQIIAIVMAIGVFVDQTRSSKQITASHSQDISALQIKQAEQEQVMLRVANLLTALEAKVSAHVEADAAVSETVRRNTEIIDRYLLDKKVR